MESERDGKNKLILETLLLVQSRYRNCNVSVTFTDVENTFLYCIPWPVIFYFVFEFFGFVKIKFCSVLWVCKWSNWEHLYIYKLVTSVNAVSVFKTAHRIVYMWVGAVFG